TLNGTVLQVHAQSSDIRRFDLGTNNSPVWPGYTALTPKTKYTNKRGFGFTKLSHSFARDHNRPNALTQDFISADNAHLRVDLPNGKYQIYLISGDSQVSSSSVYWLYFNSIIKINGKKVWK